MKTKSVEDMPSVVTIDKYVREINRLHQELCKDAETALEKAVRIGGMLNEIRPTVPHGEWNDWLGERFSFTHKTACKYMKAAEAVKINPRLNFESLAEAIKSLGPTKAQEPEKFTKFVAQQVEQEPEQPEPTEPPDSLLTV